MWLCSARNLFVFMVAGGGGGGVRCDAVAWLTPLRSCCAVTQHFLLDTTAKGTGATRSAVSSCSTGTTHCPRAILKQSYDDRQGRTLVSDDPELKSFCASTALWFRLQLPS
ncbi:uncharacterized protein LOC143911976 [Arctopsyche grandis]|uniref:uncharacterized protein LOC143911976 n=1 Tax=Arctopsyche grandis TaxID=121162 RepID=UPI00406D6C81